jgi:hypothetical protein
MRAVFYLDYILCEKRNGGHGAGSVFSQQNDSSGGRVPLLVIRDFDSRRSFEWGLL